jgi:RNA polymerase sigma factor (sigma-70 family)
MKVKNRDINSLVEKYGLVISRLSHRMIKNNEIAREAAQEVWYEIIRSIDSFKGNSEISTWIYTIARRTILKYAKNEKLVSESDIEKYANLGPLEYNEAEENKMEWIRLQCDSCLTALCHCLNNEARLIFLFRELAGLSYTLISEIMEMKEDNVRQITSRSFNKVKNFLNNDCPLYNPQGACRCRIKKQILSINLEKEYSKLEYAANLVDFFLKFDKELPRINYWKKIITETVTN